jgi:Tol biopolymer transport system component
MMLRKIVILSVVLVLALVGLIGMSLVAGRVLPGGNQVVYMGENYRLYLYDLQTGYTRQISEWFERSTFPQTFQWSDDHQTLSFLMISGRNAFDSPMAGEIHTLNIRDQTLEKLTIGETLKSELAWSPDGHWIAFTDFDNRMVYLTDETGNIRRLMENEGQYYNLSWSPDSTQLTFSAFQGSDYVITLIDIDSGDISVLNIMSTTPMTSQWSPDGTRLALTRVLESEFNIYIWDFTRETLERLEFPPDQVLHPVWSPDGERLAVTQIGQPPSFSHLWIVDGENAHQLTNAWGANALPSWSRDGRWLAFMSNREKTHYALYLQWMDRLDAPPVRIDAVQPGYPFLWR